MSNCPHCQAPVPAPKPGASRPLNFCQACGKALSGGAVKSSPAKTLMWSGGPIPGLPIKPPESAPAAPPAPQPAPAVDPVSPPVAEPVKRRTPTADIGVAATIVPPAPDQVPAPRRQPQKTMIGSGLSAPIPGVAPAPAPAAAEVEVSMDEGAASQDAGEPAQPGSPANPVEGLEGSGPREVSGAVPDWAAEPSAGSGSKSTGQTKGRNKLVIAGVAGGAVLVVAVVAGLMSGGKPKPVEPKPAAVAPAQPAAVPAEAKPVPTAAEPSKAAEAKAEAPVPAKPVPAEKVAAKPSEAAVPAAVKTKAEPKPAGDLPVAAERPAKPVADKPKAVAEPAPAKPEKKPVESAAPSGGDKTQAASEAYQRGNAKLLSGALPEAIAAFSEAIKLNPKDVQSQRGLGLAYAQAGNTAMAVRHLKLYLKAAPHAPDRALIEKRIEQLSGR